MHSTANSPSSASAKRTPDNKNRPSRKLVGGQFYCLNEAMIGWRLVLSRPASAVYDWLAMHIKSATQVWSIEQSKMAEELEVSERWVRKGVAELEGFHLIDVQRHQRSKSTYRLLEVPVPPAPNPLDRHKVFRPVCRTGRNKMFRSREALNVPVRPALNVPVPLIDHNPLPEPKAPYKNPPSRFSNADGRNGEGKASASVEERKRQRGQAEQAQLWADFDYRRERYGGWTFQGQYCRTDEEFSRAAGIAPRPEVKPCS